MRAESLLLLLALPLSGCRGSEDNGEPCDPTPACDGIIADVHLLEGEVTYGINGSEPKSYSLTDPASGCHVAFDAVPGYAHALMITCSVDDGRVFSHTEELPEFTSLKTLGTQSVDGNSAIVVRYPDSFACETGSPDKIGVKVEAAAGGVGEPFVTPNYLRVMHMDLPLRDRQTIEKDDCQPPIQISSGFSIRIRQEAADIRKGLVACPCGV